MSYQIAPTRDLKVITDELQTLSSYIFHTTIADDLNSLLIWTSPNDPKSNHQLRPPSPVSYTHLDVYKRQSH